MNIDYDLRLALEYSGLDASAVNELVTLAGALPSSRISASVAGLTETETASLLSYVFRTIAPDLGVEFTHVDVLGTLGFPVIEPEQATSTEVTDYVEHERYSDSAS